MSTNKLYVGNIAYSATQQELEELFTRFGHVESVRIIDHKGFGFVEMSSADEAGNAITELDNFEFKGRKLKVAPAKPRDPSQSHGGRGRY